MIMKIEATVEKRFEEEERERKCVQKGDERERET
jgi:hypothetical protein